MNTKVTAVLKQTLYSSSLSFRGITSFTRGKVVGQSHTLNLFWRQNYRWTQVESELARRLSECAWRVYLATRKGSRVFVRCSWQRILVSRSNLRVFRFFFFVSRLQQGIARDRPRKVSPSIVSLARRAAAKLHFSSVICICYLKISQTTHTGF